MYSLSLKLLENIPAAKHGPECGFMLTCPLACNNLILYCTASYVQEIKKEQIICTNSSACSTNTFLVVRVTLTVCAVVSSSSASPCHLF